MPAAIRERRRAVPGCGSCRSGAGAAGHGAVFCGSNKVEVATEAAGARKDDHQTQLSFHPPEAVVPPVSRDISLERGAIAAGVEPEDGAVRPDDERECAGGAGGAV